MTPVRMTKPQFVTWQGELHQVPRESLSSSIVIMHLERHDPLSFFISAQQELQNPDLSYIKYR